MNGGRRNFRELEFTGMWIIMDTSMGVEEEEKRLKISCLIAKPTVAARGQAYTDLKMYPLERLDEAC